MPHRKQSMSTVAAPRPTGLPAPLAAAPWLADWGVQQLAVAREGASVLARGLETMRRIQEQAIRASLERRARAPSAAAGARPGHAVAVQAGLVREDFDAFTGCWRDTLAAALEMNAELLACAMHLVRTEDVFEATSRLVHEPFTPQENRA